MDRPEPQDVPLPYVFFTRSNVRYDPLDRMIGHRGGSDKVDSSSSSASGLSAGSGALPGANGGGGGGSSSDSIAAGRWSQNGIEAAEGGEEGALANSAAGAAAGAANAPAGSSSAHSTMPAGGAAGSSKGERPPIMTPDERAWNDRLINSFQTQRSLIDAIVLSPSGVVISTLGRNIEGRVKNMNPGVWIGTFCLLLMLTNLILMIWAIFNGFIYLRVIQPLDMRYTKDWVKPTKEFEVARVKYSVTTLISVFVIRSEVTFYADRADSNSMVAFLFNHSSLQRSWERLTKDIVYLMTELLLGSKTIQNAFIETPDAKPLIGLVLKHRKREGSATVPHCFQDYNALRDVWSNLYFSCLIYMAAAVAQIYISVAEVLFKRIDDFADPRDRRLSPEQMRARITIGLEGVAALQRVCFYSKLALAMQAIVTLLFLRLLIIVKNVEYNTRNMANQMEKAGLPATDVDTCSNIIFFAMACGTLQAMGTFCFHSLAKFYSSIASTKVPKVKLVPSQDESYVT